MMQGHGGVADSLDEAKAAFRGRGRMRAAGHSIASPVISPENNKIRRCVSEAGWLLGEGQLMGINFPRNSQTSRQQGSHPGGMCWVFSAQKSGYRLISSNPVRSKTAAW